MPQIAAYKCLVYVRLSRGNMPIVPDECSFAVPSWARPNR